jgi:hypothetical protein
MVRVAEQTACDQPTVPFDGRHLVFGHNLDCVAARDSPKPCWVDRLVDFYKRLRMPKLQRCVARAVAGGRMRALNDLVASKECLRA